MPCSRLTDQARAAVQRIAAVLMLSAAAAGAADDTIEIRAVEGMRFDPPRRVIEPGAKLKVLFQNADSTDQPHNIVIVKPGRMQAVLEAALALGPEGPARDYLPSSLDIIAASRLLKAGESQEFDFPAPAEPGIYPLVCTFPGHGFLMFGAFYIGREMPPLAKDTHIPESARLAPGKSAYPFPRPHVQRIFMPDAGPAAIAIALPGRQNACWDAGSCRLRSLWEGGFIDAEEHYRGKGAALPKILGSTWWIAGPEFPVRFGPDPPREVKFIGYSLKEKLPQFEYKLDGVRVLESLSEKDGAVIREFRILEAPGTVTFLLPAQPNVEATSPGRPFVDGRLRLTAEEARRFTIVLKRKP